MNIGIRDKNDNMIFTGDTLVKKCSLGLVTRRYKVGFGYYAIEDRVVYGVYLFDEEENEFYDFPFTNGINIKLINESRDET